MWPDFFLRAVEKKLNFEQTGLVSLREIPEYGVNISSDKFMLNFLLIHFSIFSLARSSCVTVKDGPVSLEYRLH